MQNFYQILKNCKKLCQKNDQKFSQEELKLDFETFTRPVLMSQKCVDVRMV